MTIDNQLNKLREIQQVEAPAFLLTRINQQIAIHKINQLL
jgi:hypothetical protein